MKLVSGIVFAILTAALSAASWAEPLQQTGDLKIQFRLKGDVPEQRVFRAAGRANATDDSLIVNPENKGIANVVVYAYTGRRGGINIPQAPGLKRKHLLAFNNGFAPHILVTKVGDSLRIINNEAVGHSIAVSFFRNDPVDVLIRPKQRAVVALQQSEPAPIPIKSHIYPWLSAYMLVLDHRFVGVSDADGQLEISGLPTGQEVVFRAFHERGTFSNEIFINGIATKWERNRFTVDINAGKNQVGVVEVPLKQFNLK